MSAYVYLVGYVFWGDSMVEEGRAAVGAVLPALSGCICESLDGLKQELQEDGEFANPENLKST